MRLSTFSLLLIFSVSVVSLRNSADILNKSPFTYRWRQRVIECEHTGNNYDITQCSLQEDSQKTTFGEGCFEEFVPSMRNLRNLCPLHCRGSDEQDFVAKIPTNNHKCNQFFNYGLTSFGNDTYLWRSGSCLNATIRFELRCGFPEKLSNLHSI